MNFRGGVFDAECRSVIFVNTGRRLHFDDIVRLAVGERDEYTVIRMVVLQHADSKPDCQAVAVRAGGKIPENIPVRVHLVIVPEKIDNRVPVERAEGVHAHRNPTVREALGDHIALCGDCLLSVHLRRRSIQENIDRDVSVVSRQHLVKDLSVIQVKRPPYPDRTKLSCHRFYRLLVKVHQQ